MTETAFDYDVVVIGSGFGGSVSSLRLTEKGYKFAVLEAASAATLGAALKYQEDLERVREKVPDLVDAIVDITETGSSLRANKLRIVDTLLETNTKLIANRASWANPAKRKKIEMIALLLRGALEAESKVGLKMNLPESQLAALLEKLPALRNPTVSHLAQNGWIAVETVIAERVVREIIPELKALGADEVIVMRS